MNQDPNFHWHGFKSKYLFKNNKNGIFLRNFQFFKRFSSFHYSEAELVLQNTIISFFIILNVQKHMQDSDLVFFYGSGAGKNHTNPIVWSSYFQRCKKTLEIVIHGWLIIGERGWAKPGKPVKQILPWKDDNLKTVALLRRNGKM